MVSLCKYYGDNRNKVVMSRLVQTHMIKFTPKIRIYLTQRHMLAVCNQFSCKVKITPWLNIFDMFDKECSALSYHQVHSRVIRRLSKPLAATWRARWQVFNNRSLILVRTIRTLASSTPKYSSSVFGDLSDFRSPPFQIELLTFKVVSFSITKFIMSGIMISDKFKLDTWR